MNPEKITTKTVSDIVDALKTALKTAENVQANIYQYTPEHAASVLNYALKTIKSAFK